MEKNPPQHDGCEGFTLIEVLIATALLSLLFLGIAPFFAARFSASQRVVEDSLPPIIGRSIADAILVGAEEHFDPVHNIFYFDYEGIRIEIDLPSPYEVREYPGIVLRDTRDGIVNSSIDPADLTTVTPGGYALSHGIIARPGANRIFDPGTIPAGDDKILRLGLYPLGPVAVIALPTVVDPNAGPNDPVPLPVFVEAVGLPIHETDLNDDGVFSRLENLNRSTLISRGALTQSRDAYEDTGPDNLPSYLEPLYDPILNPDPSGDDFDPVLNPSGPEGNGRLDRREDMNGDRYLSIMDFHIDEDLNVDGVLNPNERDINGNNLTSDRGVPTPDRPPTAVSYIPNDPNSPDLPPPAYPRESDPVRSLGYAIVVQRPSDEEIYLFRILIYKNYLRTRSLLAQATPIRRELVAKPETGQRATNMIDDDKDGVVNDDPNDPFGSPEITLDGIDNDGDGVIDDGLILPAYIHTLVLTIDSGTTISLPGDPR